MSSSKSDRCFNIAIVGATGAVGEAMLSILEERHFPVAKIDSSVLQRARRVLRSPSRARASTYWSWSTLIRMV